MYKTSSRLKIRVVERFDESPGFGMRGVPGMSPSGGAGPNPFAAGADSETVWI